MTTLTRRSMLAAGGAAALCAATPFARTAAQNSSPAIGAWTPLSDMPFPVQEIYPAPFWKDPGQGFSAKPQPYNILVCAGGLTGASGNNVTDAVTYYDPAADTWAFATPLPGARHHIALVNNNGLLYAVGGFAGDARGGWQMRANCWRLDAIQSAWRELRPMPHPLAEAACASLSGFVHVAGGRAPAGSRNLFWSDHIDTDEHWLYDAAADRWFAQAPLPTPRNSAAAAVVGGALYVIGGRTVSDGNTPAVEVYDPGSDRWEDARPMPKAQAGLAASVLNGKIYVFGGETSGAGGGVFPDAWEYNPRADEWRAVAAMARPRHGLGAVTLGNAVYVLGGASKAGAEETSAALDKFEI